MIQLFHGDCLEILPTLEPSSVDFVLADLPYGTTACKWDTVIPFEPLWAGLDWVAKENAAMAMFGSEPFSSHLRMSNIKRFKYDWIWNKNNPTGALTAKMRPMKSHESISIFGGGVYFPIMRECAPSVKKRWKDGAIPKNDIKYKRNSKHFSPAISAKRYSVFPKSVLDFDVPPRAKGTFHPTQKPVALLEYLIKTYTKEGETVLDPTMGSGSVGVACKNLGRRFIGIEKDANYFKIAKERIENANP